MLPIRAGVGRATYACSESEGGTFYAEAVSANQSPGIPPPGRGGQGAVEYGETDLDLLPRVSHGQGQAGPGNEETSRIARPQAGSAAAAGMPSMFLRVGRIAHAITRTVTYTVLC